MRHRFSAARLATAVVMAVLLLISSVLAISPNLHHHLHQADADASLPHHPASPDHQCAATLLAKGALEVSAPVSLGLPVSAPVPPLALRSQLFCALEMPYRLLPGRAPPIA